MKKTWTNKAYEYFEKETGRNVEEIQERGEKPGLWKRANLQLFKWKQQLFASGDNRWGNEVQGYADFEADSPIPDFGIFTANSTKEIRIRFFNLTKSQDGAADFRCAFLKFGDAEEAGPWDMAFMTGSASPFNDIETLEEFLTGLQVGPSSLKAWALRHPSNYYSLVDGLRKEPKEWTSLDYNNYKTYSCTTKENVMRLFRFRLIGLGNVDESKLSPDDQKHPWDLVRTGTEEKSTQGNFLSESLLRVSETHPTMMLQVQFRDIMSVSAPDNVVDPSVVWDEKECPWRNLASVILTYNVPNLPEERAKYSFHKLPEGVRLQTLSNTESYAELILYRDRALFSARGGKMTQESVSKKMTTYLIHVETGFYLFSGTNATVSIAIFGSKDRTKRHVLDKSFQNDFERGSKDAYYITAPTVGEVKFIKIYLVGGSIGREWYLRSVMIFDLESRISYDFPCFQWITSTITLPRGNAVLPQKETDPVLQRVRRMWLAHEQMVVRWKTQTCLPSNIDCSAYKDLPRDLKYATEREWEKKEIIGFYAIKLKIHRFLTALESFDDFEDFKALTDVLCQSEVAKAITANENWKRDEEFGRMTLDGINPVIIKRCQAPLDNFPVTNDMLQGILQRNLSLEQEMEAGHIYLLDYKVLKGVPRRNDRYLPTPLCMMYVRPDGALVPIAIQLGQSSEESNLIWTPHDDELDWLFAKTWVKTADIHVHALNTHYYRAHRVSEVFAVATFRNLPLAHPVFKLLVPHLKYTIAVNATALEVLLGGAGSVFYKMLAIGGHEVKMLENGYNEFHWDLLNIPKEFAMRGVDEPALLPNYHYRDDALSMWNCIGEFASKVVNLYYSSDTDVKKDHELQSWMREIKEKGLVSWNEDNGVPRSVESVSHLKEILTMIIFNVSCYHAAVNFGQGDYYIFGPNYPSAMRTPPPTKKGNTTMASFMAALPVKADQALAVAFANYLCSYSEDEVYLGEYPDAYFAEEAMRRVKDEFQQSLKRISELMKTRNRKIDVPYYYLLPERVPNSVAV
ncbi:hypothetical protein CHS0354_008875 [Potamilus streckersoni]|uniref:Lipoxygenase n=1 Tax=Potamilus streckersoni TaxID=2493646 RepID=A0AAE0VJ35_9BIVA|nr:hypothetical protein CHS0354_008875 [Potamilus streckersoni]